MSTVQEPLSIQISSELLGTTQPYNYDESFKFKSYLAVHPASQNMLNTPGAIVFNSFYQDGHSLPSDS